MYLDYKSHRQCTVIGFQESVIWTVFYASVAMIFGVMIYFLESPEKSMMFYTGWLLEKSLALDNLSVFVAIFSYFNIDKQYQHKVLFWGILCAVVFRFIFIFFGIAFYQSIGWLANPVFGLIILYTAWLMLNAGNDDAVQYNQTWYVKLAKKHFKVTNTINGKIIINGALTPVFFALIAIEISDLLFSFDSVPAIIAVTQDRFIVYTSVIFAVLGLRWMYFMVASLIDSFKCFEYSIICVLVFIGLKMLTGFHIEPMYNLLIVITIFSCGVVLSRYEKCLIN